MSQYCQRKHPRLKNYDYSSNGAYFITLCTYEKKLLLSEVVPRTSVGRGLAPAADAEYAVTVEYTAYGSIAESQLLALEKRFCNLRVDKYVIMPNHIHAILLIENDSPSRTAAILDIICAYKSLTVRECRKIGFTGSLFQTSYYDHVIRNEEDYLTRWKYIDENPIRWSDDELFG